MKGGLAVALCGLVAALPAAASDYSASEIRAISARYAACVIKSSPARARRFIVSSDQAPPVIGDCLNEAARFQGGEMRFPGSMYRYGLAEALLVRDYPQGPPAGIGQAPAIDRPAVEPLDEARLPRSAKRADAVRQRHGREEAFRAMDMLTDCVVRGNPDAAYALIRSKLDGPAETAAFNQLKPTIAQCLPADRTVKMNRSVLRGSLASNLYQMAYAVRPVDARRP